MSNSMMHSFGGALFAILVTVAFASGLAHAEGERAASWFPCAPEQYPKVTVRWEDPSQTEAFVVEGESYQCRVGTHPARILSLSVEGNDVLGAGGMAISLEDAEGNGYRVAPREITPDWQTWQGQSYKPARSSRARMNVWSAGPYYWDAHLLDIPLMRQQDIEAAQIQPQAEAAAEWTFEQGAEDWEALNNCTIEHGAEEAALSIAIEGHDPYIQSPPLDVQGPVVIAMRMRSRSGGAAFYWQCEGDGGYSSERVNSFGANADGQWHEYRIPIRDRRRLRRLRFDPPGEGGRVDVDWIRIYPARGGENGGEPARGELIFHAHPDQLRIELRVEPPEEAARPETAVMRCPGLRGHTQAVEGRDLLMCGDADATGAALLAPEGGSVDTENGLLSAPLKGDRPATCWVFRPMQDDETPQQAFVDDLHPLAANAFTVRNGYASGYDRMSGLYIIDAASIRGAYGFEPAYKNPNRRMETAVEISNDGRARTLAVKCRTGVGGLEAGVLTDAHGFPLPVPVFVCKNFGGEREEPDDTSFGDSYFPLQLEAEQSRRFDIVHVQQNWGNHPQKQISSIRFFHIYWHLSTGVSETTCFSHNWMKIGNSGILRIPDFRPMSGPMWSGQPQHQCLQWPGFLQYNGAREKLVYERTQFHSVSPNLALFTMYFHTSDGAANARIEVMEFPQTDELRTFVRLRYDWKEAVEIEGDAHVNFRWLNMFEKRLPASLSWTDDSGEIQTMELSGGEEFRGELLTTDAPFVASHARPGNYNCLTLVRDFKARLEGRDIEQIALSGDFGDSDGNYWLTVPAERLSLQEGDYIEAEVMLMPHGERTPAGFKPQRERAERFGPGIPSLDVGIGEKLADFPPTVRADDDVARMTLSGGFNYMPIIVEGFSHWKVPLLWRQGLWQDQQVHGGDGYQVEPDGSGGYRYIFVYPTRTGQKQHLTVTRAECTEGISRVFDINGSVALQSPRPGRFSLKAPAIFAPGRNQVTSASDIVEFTGAAATVRQVPLRVSVAQGDAEITILDWNADTIALEAHGGPMELTVSQLQPGHTYAVAINGADTEKVAHGGRLSFSVQQGDTEVQIRRG